MPDLQTALQALKAGEIDFFDIPPIDLIDTLESDPNIKIEVLNKTGNYGIMRLNFLYPPFNKAEARQAMLHLIDQEEFMKATFGNPKYYKKCPSNFACGTPMENDENTHWFKEAPNVAKAKELFQKAGYDGKPVTLLHATNIDFMNNAAQIAAQRLRATGINVELATSDWGGVVTRRAVKGPPIRAAGTSSSPGRATRGRHPIAFVGHQANGEKGWFGWPTDESHEKLRDNWAAAGSLRSRRRSRARCRRTPGTSCRMAGSDSGLTVAYRKNLRACWRSRRSFRSGMSRRPERAPSNTSARNETPGASRAFVRTRGRATARGEGRPDSASRSRSGCRGGGRPPDRPRPGRRGRGGSGPCRASRWILMSHRRHDRADLVGEDDAHDSPSHSRPNSSLKSIRRMPTPRKSPDRKSLTRIASGDVVHLLRRRPAEAGDMLLGDHRVAERVVLVIIFDDRARQLRAFLDPEALGERAGGDVAHHHLERDDLDLPDQLLAHVEAADEVGRHADLVEMPEDTRRCGC